MSDAKLFPPPWRVVTGRFDGSFPRHTTRETFPVQALPSCTMHCRDSWLHTEQLTVILETREKLRWMDIRVVLILVEPMLQVPH
jgi:hypothetical protein